MIMLQLNTLLLLFYFCLNSLLSFGLHCAAHTFRGSWFSVMSGDFVNNVWHHMLVYSVIHNSVGLRFHLKGITWSSPGGYGSCETWLHGPWCPLSHSLRFMAHATGIFYLWWFIFRSALVASFARICIIVSNEYKKLECFVLEY
jgi:hypothetical protein